MGRYAAYVWPAFGVCAAIMAWLVVSSHRALGHEKRLLERLEAGGRSPPTHDHQCHGRRG